MQIGYHSTHASKYDVEITRTNDLAFFGGYLEESDGPVVELVLDGHDRSPLTDASPEQLWAARAV